MALQTFTAGQVLTAAQVTALQSNDFNQTVSTKTADYTLVAADKGTRVEMNSGSATTITVDTDLFNAGDTLFIQNRGAGVCTITAGTATVSTADTLALEQFQGGTLYFVSTGVAIFFASNVGGGAWQTWAPTLSGGWANGNGTYIARYRQIGKTVHVYIQFVVGSTTTKGTTMLMSLPVPNVSGVGGFLFPVRSNVAGTPFTLMGRFGSPFFIEAQLATGTYVTGQQVVTATVPATWATGNVIQMQFTYEAA